MKISIPIPSHVQLHGGGFEAGLLHPVLGFDHLLAMVAVGIISTQMGGRSVYLVPLSFVAIMFFGSLLGMNNIQFLYDEQGIALSVLILGLAIALDKKTPIFIGMLVVAFFAFFHGHAHGAELPRAVSKVEFISGFILATAILHLLGVFIGYIAHKFTKGTIFLSHLGSAIAGIGLYILLVPYLKELYLNLSRSLIS